MTEPFTDRRRAARDTQQYREARLAERPDDRHPLLIEVEREEPMPWDDESRRYGGRVA